MSDVNLDPKDCKALQQALARYNTPTTFKIGDVVRWKPQMRIRKNPDYGECTFVTRVYPRPIFDPKNKDSGTPYFREELTGAIAFIDRDGDLEEDSVDMRRFERVDQSELVNANINKNIVCDGCGRRDFPGVRFHCTECENFDFCSECHQRGLEIKGHRRNHEMKMMEPPFLRLQALCNRLMTPSNLQPGDVVQWKEGLRNKLKPGYGEYAIVLEVLTVPIISKSSGISMAEPLDVRMAFIDEDGDMRIFFYDSRRFEKAVN